MASLAGRVAVVTGASRGIGAAIARRLASDGLKVALVARTREAIEALARELGGAPIVADVTAKGASEAIVAEVRRTLGEIDVLVPNAGVEASQKLETTSDEVWDELLAVNATAVFRLCRAALPTMITRDYGRVVVIASTASLQGYAYTSAYCASKHAVLGLVRGVAAEIARTKVTINAVCPGFVDTSMVERAADRIHRTTGRDVEAAKQALAKMSPQRRLFGADEVAHLVASLLPDEARGIHGQALALDGGATAMGGSEVSESSATDDDGVLSIVHPPAWPKARGYVNGMITAGEGERVLFVAGQIGWEPDCTFTTDDLGEQFAKALDNVLAVVAAAGGAATSIARMTIYVTDLQAYRERTQMIGLAWRKRLGKHYPAMALVGVAGLLESRAKVEIEATCVLSARPRGGGG